MQAYDLHTHSTASDGTLTPTHLMQRAAQAGITAIALTDHDTLAGLTEAQQAAHQLHLTLIPGVEISATWRERTLHIVGLHIATDNTTLQQGLAGLCALRIQRAQCIGHLLAEAGLPGDWYAKARAFSNGNLIGRAHFARALVAGGHANSVREVFKKFLVKGKPGYVAGGWTPLTEVVTWINAAGGQAVIAHPARYGLKRRLLRRLIADFVAAGGVGIEIVAGSHSQDDIYNMTQHAREFGLLASVGSDYHGPNITQCQLGQLTPLPAGCTPIWRDWPNL